MSAQNQTDEPTRRGYIRNVIAYAALLPVIAGMWAFGPDGAWIVIGGLWLLGPFVMVIAILLNGGEPVL